MAFQFAHGRPSCVCTHQQGSDKRRRKVSSHPFRIDFPKAGFLARSTDQAIGARRNFHSFGGRLNPCILIVEDNQLNRELLRDWLEVEGYDVWSAVDLKDSYEAISKRLPDAVLLDINLGKDNGLDLLAWMRQKPEAREIPVIAVTAHALVAEQEQVLKAGCRACLAKPIDFRQLKEELNRWLRDSKTSPANS